jgi:hypothetical protein
MPPPRRCSITLAFLALFTLAFLASLRWAFILSPTPNVRIGLVAGGLWFQLPNSRPAATSPFATTPMRPPPKLTPKPVYIYRHGFGFTWWYQESSFFARSWSIPLWPALLPFAGLYARQYARARWGRKPWQCPQCGYDLRGLSTATCPECGRATTL